MEKRIYKLMAEIEADHWWFAGRRAILKTVIKRVVSPRRDCCILDAGCGTGGNLNLLSEFGHVVGMEFNQEAIQSTKGKRIGKTIRGKFPQLPFKKESFELIVVLDVLEHLDDDEDFLKGVASLLKPGGFVVVTVPAFSILWSEHDRIHHHRRRYRLNELDKVMDQAGLKVEYSSYFNFLLFPLVVVIRLVKEHMGIGKGSDDLAMPVGILNTLLRSIFSIERIPIGKIRIRFGVSIISCGKRDREK